MSELNDRYDRAAVSDRITQPPFAQLAIRGRRRSHRTRTVRLAGVAALAALAATPLLTLPGQNQPDTLAALPPPTSPPAWEPDKVIVEFLDRDHGVAQYAGEACNEGWLSVTRDGGKTWSEPREQPETPYPDSPSICNWDVAIPIAPDTLVIAARVPRSQPSFISRDGGRTWQEYQRQVRSASAVPDGVIPRYHCDDEACEKAGLGWYDPATGNWMALKNQPEGAEYNSLTVAFDGSIWVFGHRSNGDVRLAVTRDRGRSWLDRSPDPNIDALADSVLTAYDADTAYLYTMRNPFALYRTTDGGKTWQPVPAAQRFKDVTFVWTTRDGGLVVQDRDRDQYLSTDGGNTFTETDLPVWATSPIIGGLQGWPLDRAAADPVDLYLSEDGLTWQPVQVPHHR